MGTYVRILVRMPFLCRRADTAPTQAWWAAVERSIGAAPRVVRELAETTSVAADAVEIQQAVGWSLAHPRWRDDDPPFVAQ
jgi:hypothetical protein